MRREREGGRDEERREGEDEGGWRSMRKENK